ncbi:four-carbon acid sugar kinase family protein [Streptosporangium sp. NPDC049376]|uniref:four-carbon acid sugar kinase family protein n=1 Tax=Streptosporangium sp. NPDC049376 TaxID=3366192 RepID=UPI0037AC3949
MAPSKLPRPPRAPAMGILAEDLQGSVAVACRLRQRGLDPVIVRHPAAVVSDADAIVVDLDLHHAAGAAEARIREWAAWLDDHGCERVEAKLNAELRGSPDALVAGIDAGQDENGILLVVPAYPTAGRVCVDGHLLAPMPVGAGLDVDVRSAIRTENAELIGLTTLDQGADAVTAHILEACARGIRRFVLDGTVEAHLGTAAQAATRLREEGHAVATASTGGWLRFYPDLGRDGFVVVVTPGNHETDLAQLRRLGAAYGSRALITTAAEAASWGTAAAHEVLASHRILALHETDRDDPDRWVVAEQLARAVRGLLDASAHGKNKCLGVVVSGGLTTTALVQQLGGTSLSAGLELEPLCPTARITGGDFDDLRLLCKATGTGSEETLLRMTRQILGA